MSRFSSFAVIAILFSTTLVRAAVETKTRYSLFPILITGYPDWEKKGKKTSWDIGIERVEHTDGKVECLLIEPMAGTTAARETWSPLHIYANLIDKSELETATVGEKEVFFEGDTKSRNGKDDEWKTTLEVSQDARESLQFTVLSHTKSEYVWRVQYFRGAVKFDDIFRVAVAPNKNGVCEGATYYCERKTDEKTCAKKGFDDYRVKHMNMKVDFKGYSSDLFSINVLRQTLTGVDRNDVKLVKAYFSVFDEIAKALKELEKILASK